MVIHPLPQKVQNGLALAFWIIAAPAWAPFVAIIYLFIKAEEIWAKLTAWPHGWSRWFAWHPVKCDPWPDDIGFRGYVWLETVWRNPDPPGFDHYRRELPVEA